MGSNSSRNQRKSCQNGLLLFTLAAVIFIGAAFPAGVDAGVVYVQGRTNGSGGPPTGAEFRILQIGDQILAWTALPSDGSPIMITDSDIFGSFDSTNTFRMQFRLNPTIPGATSPPEIEFKPDGRTVTANYLVPVVSFLVRGRTNGAGGPPSGAQFRILQISDQIYPWTNLPLDGSPVLVTTDDVFGDLQSTNTYKIEFNTVSGYVTSPPFVEDKPALGGTIVTGNYVNSGTLNINISNSTPGYTLPKGTGSGQAHWEISSAPSGYSGSTSGTTNYTNSTAKPGNYTVTGEAVSGWNYAVTFSGGVTPSATSATRGLAVGGSVTFNVTYTRKFGTMKFTTKTNDNRPLPNNAGFTFNTKPSDLVGDPSISYAGGTPSPQVAGPSNFGTGNYVIQNNDVSGWSSTLGISISSVSPSAGSFSAGLNEGDAWEFTATYTRLYGNLKVIMQTNDGRDLPAGYGYSVSPAPSDSTISNFTSATGSTSPQSNGPTSTPTGTYGISANIVTGWNEHVAVASGNPDVARISSYAEGELTEGGSLEFTITYTRQVGNIVIDVVNGSSGDGYTLPTTAGWEFTGKPADYPAPPKPTEATGGVGQTVISDAPTGSYTVKGKDIAHWKYSVTAFSNDVAPSVPPPPTGSKTYELVEGDTALFTVTYMRLVGHLQLVTATFDGRNLPVGAGWDITNHDPGDYQGPTNKSYVGGETSPQVDDDYDAATGIYTVTGLPVVGWTFVVEVKGGLEPEVAKLDEIGIGELDIEGTLEFTVTYTINRYDVTAVYWDPLNSVEVPGGVINPALSNIEHGQSTAFTAVTEPTNWELLGTGSYSGTSSGVTMVGNVATVNNVGSEGAVRIDVKLKLGELEVIILPESIRPQAGWRQPGQVGYKPSWPAPGGTELLQHGFYDVEFKDVDGWFTPATQVDVQIFPNAKTTITALYTEVPAGSLQVFIEDNLDDRVLGMGAQWQPIFPSGSTIGIYLADTWYNSGDIIAGVDPGSVGLRFKTVSGFILPELGGATVEEDKKTVATGEYYRSLIIHKSDYNGDGTDDLAVFDGGSGTWSVASISKPAATPGAVDLFETKFGKSDDIPTAGDYDGDGVADLAYWREKTGEWRVNKQFKLKNFGQFNDIPVPGDYNGDGMTDPALYRPSTGEWMIYNMQTQKMTKVSFGGFAEVPVPGNFDADQTGMTDLAVYNVETRQWRVAIYDANKEAWVERKKVRINGTKIKLNSVHGAVGNVPVQADYNGDGATDLAVYVRGSSEWNIRGADMIQLGEKGDVPVPNDWAGLGRVIPTIFHPQNGRWLAIDNLLKAKHGKGGQPLMSGR